VSFENTSEVTNNVVIEKIKSLNAARSTSADFTSGGNGENTDHENVINSNIDMEALEKFLSEFINRNNPRSIENQIKNMLLNFLRDSCC